MSTPLKLLDEVTSNGVSTATHTLNYPAFATVQVQSNDFGGGTVTIQGRPNNTGDYVSLGSEAEFTSSGWVNVFTSGSMQIRANVASTTSPDPITVTVL